MTNMVESEYTFYLWNNLRTDSFFGTNMYVKPSVTGDEALDMHRLIDEQETWMGR